VRRAWHEPIGTMPRAVFAELMEQVQELPPGPTPLTIHLSGYGEPMAHPHFLEFVALAKATGAKVEATTNGTLLDEKMANALLDLDLDRLVVSLDGASAASFEGIRERGSFQQVIDNLHTLKRLRMQRTGRAGGRHANPQLALAFVAMRENIADLAKLPRLANQLGAWEILVSNLVPHTAELEQEILYSRALTACAYRESRWVPALSLPKLDYNADTVAPLQSVINSTASIAMAGASLSAPNDYCRFAQEGFAAVRWDGEVSPCLSLLHDHPEYIRGRRKDVTHHTFGNIRHRPLRAIWAGPAFCAFREQVRAFHFSPCTTCGGCERFSANFEDCTGNGFPTCGGCLWAQGFVQCA
jgi:MoaA/NifB/PqqE/SkfB family radical SAM enzyme